jgi:hypothetical protein
MHTVARLAAGALAACALLAVGPPARAQDEAQTVVIGTTRLFTIRVGDTVNARQLTVQERIDHIQDVFAKYLGGPFGKITWKPWRDRVHLYLNGEFLLGVSPEDARATGYKNAQQLAPIWANALQRGFKEAHVKVTGR